MRIQPFAGLMRIRLKHSKSEILGGSNKGVHDFYSPKVNTKASLTRTPEEYAAAPKPHESALTQLRSFKEGCLRDRHPSRSLFSTIKAIEKAAQEAFDENTIVGDLFWIVLEKLEWFPLPSLGCTAHDQDMMARVVKFYIGMRMFFFCKKSNQKLQLSEKAKNARKKVKLL